MEKNNLNKIDYQDERFMMGLNDHMKKSMSSLKILEDSGLVDTQDHAEKVFQHAKNTYKKSNIANFSRKSMQLD